MKVGDLVICRCEFSSYPDTFDFDVNLPEINKIYTVRSIFVYGSYKGILLEEIHNRKIDVEEFGPMEVQFEETCFDVIPTADISELKQLL